MWRILERRRTELPAVTRAFRGTVEPPRSTTWLGLTRDGVNFCRMWVYGQNSTCNRQTLEVLVKSVCARLLYLNFSPTPAKVNRSGGGTTRWRTPTDQRSAPPNIILHNKKKKQNKTGNSGGGFRVCLVFFPNWGLGQQAAMWRFAGN